MRNFRDTTFDNRQGQAAEAKKKALEQLRSRPPVDPAVAAERKAASEERERIKAEKAAVKSQARQDAAEAAEAEAAAAAAAKSAAPTLPTQAELKAARDARYAARKKRK